MNKPSTTTFVLLAGLIVISSIYFLYSSNDINNTTFSIAQGNNNDESVFIKPLTVSSCTPSMGFDYCYQNSYYYHGASPYVQIQGTDLIGKSGYGNIDGGYNEYYIDEVYVNIKHIGDRFTVLEGRTDFGDPCGSAGCVGQNVVDGKYIIAKAPDKNPPKMFFMSWDKDYEWSYWAWTSVYWGYVDSNPNFEFYVIDCYDDSDVQEGYFCDKSGSWETWTAKQNMCIGVDTPNICNGFDLYSQSCDQNTGYVSQGTLIEANSATCGYVCQEGDTQSMTCTDGTAVIKSTCDSNQWIIKEHPEQSCPLNWNNIDMILTAYLNQITTIIKGLLP